MMMLDWLMHQFFKLIKQEFKGKDLKKNSKII